MPEIVSPPAAVGFHGKIPSRGDFVRAGLPRGFTDAWDGWMQRMLAASRASFGDAWLPAWLEAPVWRFALSAGICGPDAVIGLWMPSVDRVGRYYPLTIAATVPGAERPAALEAVDRFLASAECAGRGAIADNLAPDELGARLAATPVELSGLPACSEEGGFWWTN
jgi:type VI secretion system protein ImpM